MNKKFWGYIILLQALLAVLGSLYYGWYGDIVMDFINGTMFHRGNGYIPCELCRFARIFMYPILFISIIGIIKKSSEYIDYILALAIPGFLLELYQYYFQMANTKEVVKSVICGTNSGANCAATDVMYGGFVTIPFLCLLAFTIIIIACYFYKKSSK